MGIVRDVADELFVQLAYFVKNGLRTVKFLEVFQRATYDLLSK